MLGFYYIYMRRIILFFLTLTGIVLFSLYYIDGERGEKIGNVRKTYCVIALALQT